MRTGWWLTALPGAAIMVTVLAINSIGDWLRDALDPRQAD
jgi:peptide/nickel transport system permease protein